MLERSRPGGAQDEPHAEVQCRRLTLRELAEAAMCDKQSFRREAFAAVTALQVALKLLTPLHPQSDDLIG